jgi:hypothetical protein
LISIWTAISVALIEIMVGAAAGNAIRLRCHSPHVSGRNRGRR